MLCRAVIVTTILIGLWADSVVTLMTAAQKKEILDKHNELRSKLALNGDSKGNQPPAADMPKMTWDDNEAEQAERWAANCTIGHDRSGQNWAGGYGSVGSLGQLWYNEVSYYTFATHGCMANKVCGHYTQFVWSESVAVGCGVADCKSKGSGYPVTLVCNYRAMGNLQGHRPYKEGPGCSLCPKERPFCENGLCVAKNECTTGNCPCKLQCKNGGKLNANSCSCDCENGYYGNSCDMECTDRYEWCSWGSVRGDCKKYGSYCQISCGNCMHKCDKKCQNGGVLDRQLCKCVCPKAVITGDLCEKCEMQCKNGGRINKATCSCFCPDNFMGDACETPCKDKASWCSYSSVQPSCKTKYKDYCQIACKSCIWGPQDCLTTKADGTYEYSGKVSVAKNGVPCQRWNSETPNSKGGRYTALGEAVLTEMGNYCRNPISTHLKPWCYTDSTNSRWDYCDIPAC